MTLTANPEHDGVLGLDDAGEPELVLDEAGGLELVTDDTGGLELLVVGDLLRSVKIPAITAPSTAARTAPIAPMAGADRRGLDAFPAEESVTSGLSLPPRGCEPMELLSAVEPEDGWSSGMCSCFPS
jgi:hypothetical protein